MTPTQRHSVRRALRAAMNGYPGNDEECETRCDALAVAKFRIRAKLNIGWSLHAATWNVECSAHDAEWRERKHG